MINLWLGASTSDAQYVFLLPNKPILPDDVDEVFLAKPDSAVLIELNGNHWRKILTIIAKLIGLARVSRCECIQSGWNRILSRSTE